MPRSRPGQHSPVGVRSAPPPLEGVVFDLDGTLISSPLDFRAMRREIVRTAGEFGCRIPGGSAAANDLSTAQLLSAVREEMARMQLSKAMMKRFEVTVNRRLDLKELKSVGEVRPRPGAIDLLDKLKARSYHLGILTRSSTGYCHAALERVAFSQYFPNCRTRSTRGPMKPDPQALLSLLRTMGVRPSRAVFVGDHLDDARCAMGAGVDFVAILPEDSSNTQSKAVAFRRAGAWKIYRDYEQVTRWFSRAGYLGTSEAVVTP